MTRHLHDAREHPHLFFLVLNCVLEFHKQCPRAPSSISCSMIVGVYVWDQKNECTIGILLSGRNELPDLDGLRFLLTNRNGSEGDSCDQVLSSSSLGFFRMLMIWGLADMRWSISLNVRILYRSCLWDAVSLILSLTMCTTIVIQCQLFSWLWNVF